MSFQEGHRKRMDIAVHNKRNIPLDEDEITFAIFYYDKGQMKENMEVLFSFHLLYKQ